MLRGDILHEASEEMQQGFDDYELRLGDVMRGERATLGKSLEDVEFDLKIKKSYIQAIEESDAEEFKSKGFISGYVRSYASYLNMDPEEAFTQFCEESGYDGLKTSLEIAPDRKRERTALVAGAPSTAKFDPLISPIVANRGLQAGVLPEISIAGIVSVMVLIGLVGGIGYGGWTVLQEVQRVEFAPVNSSPELAGEIDQFKQDDGSQDVALALVDLGDTNAKALEQLYRPQELEVPQLIARDGPIAAINPDSIGVFSPPTPEVNPQILTADLTSAPIPVPVVTVAGPPPVDIIAENPAWVRITQASGGTLFEKVLDAGERYRVPADVADAVLRAGNSGSVYVMIGDQTYGPVGVKTGVARNVDLTPDVVKVTYAKVNDLFDTVIASPVNGLAPAIEGPVTVSAAATE